MRVLALNLAFHCLLSLLVVGMLMCLRCFYLLILLYFIYLHIENEVAKDQ